MADYSDVAQKISQLQGLCENKKNALASNKARLELEKNALLTLVDHCAVLVGAIDELSGRLLLIALKRKEILDYMQKQYDKHKNDGLMSDDDLQTMKQYIDETISLSDGRKILEKKENFLQEAIAQGFHAPYVVSGGAYYDEYQKFLKLDLDVLNEVYNNFKFDAGYEGLAKNIRKKIKTIEFWMGV